MSWCNRNSNRFTLQPIWRCIAAIIPDLATFSNVQLLFLFLFAAISIIFSIIDFNVLLHPEYGKNSTIKFINDQYPPFNMELWRRAIMCLSGVCSFTGVLGVVLTTKKKRSNYFWGLINSILYGIYAFAYGYAGDAQLYIVYFTPMQIVGMYSWDGEQAMADKEGGGSSAIINTLSWKQWIMYLILLFLIGVAFYFEIPVFAAALNGYYIFDPAVIGTYAPLVLDATSNAFNVIAQILMLQRYWEMWFFWIIVDITQIAMWSGISTFPPDFNILVMWTLFLINALLGLYVWFTSRQKQDKIVKELETGKEIPSDSDESNNNNDARIVAV